MRAMSLTKKTPPDSQPRCWSLFETSRFRLPPRPRSSRRVVFQIDSGMAPSADPRSILASSPMSALQIAVVAITLALTALDGFDVLSISIASPGIAADWHIDRAVLGVVLSAELGGMAAGSLWFGVFPGRKGRRPIVL